MPAAVSAVSETILQGFGQTPAEGALPVLMAATAADLPGGSFVGPGGIAEVQGAPIVVGASRTARNRELQRLLTREAERLTGRRDRGARAPLTAVPGARTTPRPP